MFLECRRKSAYPERTHTNTERTLNSTHEVSSEPVVLFFLKYFCNWKYVELYVCGNVSHAEKLAEKQIYSQKNMYKKMAVLNISQVWCKASGMTGVYSSHNGCFVKTWRSEKNLVSCSLWAVLLAQESIKCSLVSKTSSSTQAVIPCKRQRQTELHWLRVNQPMQYFLWILDLSTIKTAQS